MTQGNPDKVEFYCDSSTHGAFFAKQGASWFVVPATPDGWSKRRDWNPCKAMEKRVATQGNRMGFYGHAWLAEQFIGVPREIVSVIKP